MANANPPAPPKINTPGVTARWSARRGEWAYTARVRVGSKVVNATFPTQRECRSWIAEQRHTADTGAWIDPRKGKSTFGDWADRWMATKVGAKPGTRDRYDQSLRIHVLPKLGHLPIAAVDRSTVQILLAEVESTVSRGSAASVRSVLSGVLGFAADSGAIHSNPARGAKLQPEQKVERAFFTPAEVEAIAEAITPHFALAIRVAGFMGLRSGELWALKAGAVDLLHRRVEVRESISASSSAGKVTGSTKTHRARRVPIPAGLVDAFAERLATLSPDDYVFPAQGGGSVWHRAFCQRHFHPALQAAGLADRGATFHGLRHSCASMLLGVPGASVPAVANVMGHSPRVLLDVYAHHRPEEVDHLTAGLDAHLGAARAARAAEAAAPLAPVLPFAANA